MLAVLHLEPIGRLAGPIGAIAARDNIRALFNTARSANRGAAVTILWALLQSPV
jgi:hypothetical protein